MNEEEIRRLQEELRVLQEQVNVQAQKIAKLEQRQVLWPQPLRRREVHSFSVENFIGLKLIQFIGIIVLVIGLTIGVKYAIDRNLISPLLRIVLAYAAGLVLYGLSVRLKRSYMLFSALLFSGGMASLYFTTYGAFVYYALFPFSFSFGLMVLLTIYTVFEAMRYNRQEIAMLGLVGAYGIPFLISQNSGRVDLLFLYISLINCGVVFLSVRKLWRTVGRLAQLLTWVLFLGIYSIRIQMTESGWPFLLFFYALFTFAVVALRVWKKQQWTSSERWQLLTNNIALYAGVLLLVTNATPSYTSAAWATLGVSVPMILEAAVVQLLWRDEEQVMKDFGLSGMVLFITFIALNWDGFTVTLLWLLTSVVIFVWGFIYHSVTARLLAIILTGVTLAKLVIVDSISFTTVQKVVAYLILGVLLLIASFFYQKFRQRIFNSKE